jgi:hypothetical protein
MLALAKSQYYKAFLVRLAPFDTPNQFFGVSHASIGILPSQSINSAKNGGMGESGL